MSDVPLLTIAEELAMDSSKCRNMVFHHERKFWNKSRFSNSNSEHSDSQQLLMVDIC